MEERYHLTIEEFHVCLQRLHISPATEALINHIHSSPPVRKYAPPLSLGQFQYMVDVGEMKIVTGAAPLLMMEVMRCSFARASLKVQEKANWRWGQILAYASEEKISVMLRSI